MASTRTSGRRAGTRKTYTTDAFDGLEDILGEAVEDPITEAKRRRREAEDGDDDDADFGEQQALEAEMQDAQDEEEELREDLQSDGKLDSEREDSDADAGAEPSEVGETNPTNRRVQSAHAARTPRKANTTITQGARSTVRWKKGYGIDQSTVPKMAAFDRRAFGAPAKVTNYTRGVPDYHHSMSRPLQVIYIFGSASEDLKAFQEIKSKYFEQLSLPSRRPITKQGVTYGGLGANPFHTPERREREATQGWAWYRDGGRRRFQQLQKTTINTSTSTRVIEHDGPPLSCLVGPPMAQQVRKVAAGTVQPLTELFTPNPNIRWDTHHGWLMHAGRPVQCLSWVQNRSSRQQLLCIVTRPSEDILTSEGKDVSAFLARSGFQSNMQIWQFDTADSKIGARPDPKMKPRLRAVLTWDWGDLRKMEWCPTVKDVDEADENHLGLLAGVWRDGKLRVLDIHLPEVNDDPNMVPVIHFSQAAFEVQPPDTVCTTAAWLSSSTVVAGLANGCVAIWNISRALGEISRADSTSGASVRPFFYHKLHDTYVLSLTTCYPSRPHLIITQAIDGTTRTTSILDPAVDFSSAQRSRVSVSAMAWLDTWQSLLSTDENGAISYTAMRRFFTRTLVHKLSGLISDISVSPLHPCSLSACADGSVWAINSIRRARHMRGETWAQVWFRHEWRRPVSELVLSESIYNDANPKQQTASSSGPLPDFNHMQNEPLIRITDGYKLTSAGQANDKVRKSEGVMLTTIHESLSEVTKVAWNPNIRAGTWAAAGMATGLVRVEDLGID